MANAEAFADGWQKFTEDPQNFLFASNMIQIAAFEKTNGSILLGGKLATLHMVMKDEPWEISEYPAIRENPDENIKEILFSSGCHTFLILTTSQTGANFEFLATYRWDYHEKVFQEIPLAKNFDGFPEVFGDFDLLFAGYEVDTVQHFAILSVENGYHFYFVDFGGNFEESCVKYYGFVEANGRGRALNAFTTNKNLYFTTEKEINGSWDNSTVLKYDFIEKELIELPIVLDGPTFFNKGTLSNWYVPDKYWGFCGGKYEDGVFNGESWAIQGFENNELIWIRRDQDARFEVDEDLKNYVILTSPAAFETFLFAREKSFKIFHE
ncbi:unnamed protein product [Caenorhabditis angaria]|uniref:Uncharacterized protein n=1 Tax=Caenorhabditis angaria TaxID=860376 RepID=A0A9P1IUY2_9PELO|nr:unnamed protein product [Caenorhabditis angaria]